MFQYFFPITGKGVLVVLYLNREIPIVTTFFKKSIFRNYINIATIFALKKLPILSLCHIGANLFWWELLKPGIPEIGCCQVSSCKTQPSRSWGGFPFHLHLPGRDVHLDIFRITVVHSSLLALLCPVDSVFLGTSLTFSLLPDDLRWQRFKKRFFSLLKIFVWVF